MKTKKTPEKEKKLHVDEFVDGVCNIIQHDPKIIQHAAFQMERNKRIGKKLLDKLLSSPD